MLFPSEPFQRKISSMAARAENTAGQPIDTADVAGKMQTGTEISMGTEVAQNV
jgi:hypothetical protein